MFTERPISVPATKDGPALTLAVNGGHVTIMNRDTGKKLFYRGFTSATADCLCADWWDAKHYKLMQALDALEAACREVIQP